MVLRWLLVAIGVALAVVLIARDNLLIGTLVAAAALGRAALLWKWRHRPQQFRRRNPKDWSDPG